MEAVRRKMTDVKGGMNDFASGPRRDAFDLNAIIQHSVDQSELAASKCLQGMFDRKTEMLQQGEHDALSSAAGGVQM